MSSQTRRHCRFSTTVASAFTLIELLVVISIIGLLVSILIPALHNARAQAKLTTCKSNMRQLGLAIAVYADQHREFLPRGPKCDGMFDFACEDYATNQIWIGAGLPPGPPSPHPHRYLGLGMLLEEYANQPSVYYCPADDTENLQEELPNIKTDFDAYGSYTYRQLDVLPDYAKLGRISKLGKNVVQGVSVPVEALIMDTSSLGPGDYHHTNHQAKKTNILFKDQSVQTFSNEDEHFSITAETFQNPALIFFRLDQVFLNADFAAGGGDPAEAPQFEINP